MLPVFEPTLVLFQPLVTGLAVLGAVAVAGMLVVVALVVRAMRPVDRARATVTPLRRRLDEAA